MSESYDKKKYGADKIAFFGLFIISVLIAYFVVVARSIVVFSKPIELNYAALSVSVPSGNGWQSEREWRYQENSFTLSSFFAPRRTSAAALVYCRYPLAAATITPDAQLKQKASVTGGAIAGAGQSRVGEHAVMWIHIKRKKPPLDIFFGTVQLPNNRQLDIEVHQIAGGTNLAEKIFNRIVKSLEFKDNQLLEEGSKLVAEIKKAGLNCFLGDRSKQDFFLIKNGTVRYDKERMASQTAEAVIGFTMDAFADLGSAAKLNMQVVNFLHIRSKNAQEQVTFFQGANNLDEFVWRNETSREAGRSGAEAVLDRTGIITVRRYGVQVEEENYQPGPAAIPNIVGEFVFIQMLERDCKKLFVDMIDADGTIIPLLVSKVEGKDIAADEKAAYILKEEFLDGSGFSEWLYFDGKKQIFKRIVQRDGIYILERCSEEDILKQFPEWGDYILHRNKILEQNR